MLNRAKHQLLMGRILKDIYSEMAISSLMGFKGGTCAYFFYNLSRFSVDLDFDLLAAGGDNQKIIFTRLNDILNKYGKIKEQYLKKSTIFALLSYGEADHNIKIEVNTRQLAENIKEHYELREYLGISMLVAKPDYMFASKLAALTLRKETAMRDIYDIYYFAKNNWDINADIIRSRTGKSVPEYLAECIVFIDKVKDSHILQGLGELVADEKEKAWIRSHLKAETIFLLKNYLSVIRD